MSENDAVTHSPWELATGQMVLDSLAYMDLFDRFDSWFGHWWSRPFWKADNPLVAFLENLTWQGHKRFAIPRAGEFSGYTVMDAIAAVLRPDVIASMADRPHGRSWPAGQRKARNTGRASSRRATRRKRAQSAKAASPWNKMTSGRGVNRSRRPARPRRPGQSR